MKLIDQFIKQASLCYLPRFLDLVVGTTPPLLLFFGGSGLLLDTELACVSESKLESNFLPLVFFIFVPNLHEWHVHANLKTNKK